MKTKLLYAKVNPPDDSETFYVVFEYDYGYRDYLCLTEFNTLMKIDIDFLEFEEQHIEDYFTEAEIENFSKLRI